MSTFLGAVQAVVRVKRHRVLGAMRLEGSVCQNRLLDLQQRGRVEGLGMGYLGVAIQCSVVQILKKGLEKTEPKGRND